MSDPLVDARTRRLDEAVAQRRVLVCTGAGGVGKTTTAAALALQAARLGRRTIVLTIDPARRLAQSLGLDTLDNTPRPVSAPGIPPGMLDAMMLDMKRTFDEVVERSAGDAARVQRIMANRFYQQLTETLAGTQEYMAMEKLADLHAGGGYDLIVVDTPPTRNALDFLDAPNRLTDFLEGRFLKMFLRPGFSAGKAVGRAVGIGTGLFMKAASRLTGAQVLDDLADFFQSFEGMYEGFKSRAQKVYRLLQSPQSAFVVVASPEPAALREARYFLQRLAQEGMPTAGLVVNRMSMPPHALEGIEPAAAAAAIARLGAGKADERTVAVLLELHAERRERARREQRAIGAALHGVDPRALIEVPLLPTDVHDAGALLRLGEWMIGAPPGI
jgi:anion-transporting  ArsA/GET3 family ATPase